MNLLAKCDPELSNNFRRLGFKVGNFLWSSWANLYTDLLPKSDWLLLFDHLVAYPEYPELFFALPVAELIIKRSHLLQADESDLQQQLSDMKIDNIKLTLRTTVGLLNANKDDACRYAYSRSVPLNKGNYQPFKFVPASLNNY